MKDGKLRVNPTGREIDKCFTASWKNTKSGHMSIPQPSFRVFSLFQLFLINFHRAFNKISTFNLSTTKFLFSNKKKKKNLFIANREQYYNPAFQLATLIITVCFVLILIRHYSFNANLQLLSNCNNCRQTKGCRHLRNKPAIHVVHEHHFVLCWRELYQNVEYFRHVPFA